MVEYNVNTLLNQLTVENFDSVSDQIISWANKSEDEKDARTLFQITKLVFEKSMEEAKGERANLDAAPIRPEQAKRRLIRFIGELFKVRMVTKRVVHECVIKLLSNV